eukprot:8507535-Pyramimonas_sp.AAC.1
MKVLRAPKTSQTKDLADQSPKLVGREDGVHDAYLFLYFCNWHDVRVTAQKVAQAVKQKALEVKEEARAVNKEGGASLIQNSLLEQHVTGAGI